MDIHPAPALLLEAEATLLFECHTKYWENPPKDVWLTNMAQPRACQHMPLVGVNLLLGSCSSPWHMWGLWHGCRAGIASTGHPQGSGPAQVILSRQRRLTDQQGMIQTNEKEGADSQLPDSKNTSHAFHLLSMWWDPQSNSPLWRASSGECRSACTAVPSFLADQWPMLFLLSEDYVMTAWPSA